MCICTHHKSFKATGGVVNPDFARRLERERDEAQQYVKELYIEMDGLFNHISFLQDALCKTREQYRLSSVCRELRSENERLKRLATWPHDADPFTSPDHDNDRHYP